MKRIFFSFYAFVIITLLVIQFAANPVIERVVENHVSRKIAIYWQNIVKGYFHILEADLGDRPVDRWDEKMAELQAHFSFPITVAPMASLELSPAHRNTLARGEILVIGDAEMFRGQIGDSGMVLTMGPIPEFEGDFALLRTLIFASLFLLLAVLSLIWALPFAKRLKNISTAAIAFGEGQLDMRAAVPSRSALAPMAGAFNRMADRIQELITSHKELTHAVSHELRTPLARIRFSLEMTATARDSIVRERHLQEVHRDVDELDLLITEMLTYAKFDRESFRPQMEQVVLARWLMELTAVVDREFESLDIDCRINSPDIQVAAFVSARYLERALRNLIQNAGRYARQRIHVTLETADGMCLVHVDDDGPGIPEADRHRIFEPFVRLDESRSRASGGHGLGLAIVRRVAQWHNGRVTVSEAPMGGARFTLRWPMAAQSVEASGLAESEAAFRTLPENPKGQ